MNSQKHVPKLDPWLTVNCREKYSRLAEDFPRIFHSIRNSTLNSTLNYPKENKASS